MNVCPVEGKISFPDGWEAARAALMLTAKGLSDAQVNIYPCTGCGGFHWGHSPRSGKPPSRRKRDARRRVNKARKLVAEHMAASA